MTTIRTNAGRREWPTTVEQDAASRASYADAAEFRRIQKFLAACRRKWPGARIVIRPDTTSSPEKQESATKENIEQTNTNNSPK